MLHNHVQMEHCVNWEGVSQSPGLCNNVALFCFDGIAKYCFLYLCSLISSHQNIFQMSTQINVHNKTNPSRLKMEPVMGCLRARQSITWIIIPFTPRGNLSRTQTKAIHNHLYTWHILLIICIHYTPEVSRNVWWRRHFTPMRFTF
jgi:hypothetical protein